jgi:acyl-CoA synthetase (NDP forming)
MTVFQQQGLPHDGALVTPMASGRLELIIGAKQDSIFGPVVTVGAGGKYVEIFDDLELLVPPLSREAIERAVSRLRIGPILTGVRGEAPVDLGKLADLLRHVAEMMADPAERIDSVDLNPVFVDQRGLTIADALLVVRE